MNRIIKTGLLLLTFCTIVFSQVSESEKRYVKVGELQSHFTAYGSERAYNNIYYEGLQWPASYMRTDNSVIKRYWIALQNFTDAKGDYWDVWGSYVSMDYARNSLFPVKMKQTAKFEIPAITVDGINTSSVYLEEVDHYNPDQIADRIVENVVHTSCGITISRTIYAFSQGYHDDYFIKVFEYKNDGFVDYDSVVVLNQPVKGFRVGWGTRYACSREAGYSTHSQQVWGKFSWVTIRGENYPDHVNDVLTESTPIDPDNFWLRSGFSWFGQAEGITYDNIGGPYRSQNGRLSTPQFLGTAILHVDKSGTDKNDDPYQPAVLGWHAGDTYPSVGNLTESNKESMIALYDFLSGNPYGSNKNGGAAVIGQDPADVSSPGRMYENYCSEITTQQVPYTIHGDGGGTNVWITYGPISNNSIDNHNFYHRLCCKKDDQAGRTI